MSSITEELLAKATVFTFNALPDEVRFESDESHYFDVTVEKRSQDTWAVKHRNNCFNTNLAGVYESLPSNRTDEFIANYRFTLAEAVEIAERLSHVIKLTGSTAEEYAEWWLELPDY
jgi:hypothetical protein